MFSVVTLFLFSHMRIGAGAICEIESANFEAPVVQLLLVGLLSDMDSQSRRELFFSSHFRMNLMRTSRPWQVFMDSLTIRDFLALYPRRNLVESMPKIHPSIRERYLPRQVTRSLCSSAPESIKTGFFNSGDSTKDERNETYF